jgi:hypothetical protein
MRCNTTKSLKRLQASHALETWAASKVRGLDTHLLIHDLYNLLSIHNFTKHYVLAVEVPTCRRCSEQKETKIRHKSAAAAS